MANYVGANVNMTIVAGDGSANPTGNTYIPGDVENGIAAYVEDLMYRLEAAQDLNTYKTDFEIIRQQLEETAKSFIESNGTIKTGKMYNSTKATINGNTISLGVPGVPYAGHIEWGFTAKDGMPHGPWPFIRPAMHLVSANSTNQLGEAVMQAISGTRKVQFGRNYTNPAYGGRNIGNLQNKFQSQKGLENGNNAWVKASNGIRGTNWRGQIERYNYHGEL